MKKSIMKWDLSAYKMRQEIRIKDDNKKKKKGGGMNKEVLFIISYITVQQNTAQTYRNISLLSIPVTALKFSVINHFIYKMNKNYLLYQY